MAGSSAKSRDSEAEPSAQSRRVRKPEAIVLSSDDGLLIELGPVLGERFRTRPVDSPAELPDPEVGNWFAIIDASTRDRARALVAQIEQRHPNAPLIVVHGDRGMDEWRQAMQRGHVCALVPRMEVVGQSMNHALDAAVARLQAPAGAQPAPAAQAGARSATAAAGSASGRGRPAGLLLAGAALLAASAGVWWWKFHAAPAAHVATPIQRTAPSAAEPGALPASQASPAAAAAAAAPAAAAATAPLAPVPARNVEQLLSGARMAFADQRNLLPKGAFTPGGDSALEMYAAVLQQQPANEEAREGLSRLYSMARSRMQSDLAAGRLDEAQRMLGVFKSAGLQPEAMRSLEGDIAAARPRWLLNQARAAAGGTDLEAAEQLLAQATDAGADRAGLRDVRRLLDARKAELGINELAAQVRASIASGALLEPANDNARTRFASLRNQARGSSQLAAVQKELQVALLTRAQSATRDQQFDVAQRYLTAAAEYGNGSDLADARKALQNATDQVNRAAQAEAARKTADAAVAAQPAAPVERGCVTARPTRQLNVIFPAQAQTSNTTGYVIVQFMLSAKGHADDVTVLESQPAGLFDRAAINAVDHGRFDTSALAGDKAPRCARLRITFKPG